MVNLMKKLKLLALPVSLSVALALPCFARDKNLKEKDNDFVSIGVSKFGDESMNEEWGNAFPLSIGYNTYLAKNLRYEGSGSFGFNRNTYSLDNNVVSYSQYYNFIITASLQLVMPQEGFDLFLGGGLEWSTLKFKENSIDDDKPYKEKVEGAGMVFIGGAEIPISEKLNAMLSVKYSSINPYKDEYGGFEMGAITFSAGLSTK